MMPSRFANRFLHSLALLIKYYRRNLDRFACDFRYLIVHPNDFKSKAMSKFFKFTMDIELPKKHTTVQGDGKGGMARNSQKQETAKKQLLFFVRNHLIRGLGPKGKGDL